ncbi:MAG TPA: phosphatidylglycerol lysyltransferase domain-containing protein [Armatimonadota bacterium]
MPRTSPVAFLAAVVVFAMGAINILSALVGISRPRLALVLRYLPLEVHHGTRTLTVLAGMLLILLSWSLFRRKHRGWVAAVILLALSVVLHLVKGLDVEEASVAAVVLAFLLLARREFIVRSYTHAWRNALVASVLAVVGSLGYGVLGFALLRAHFAPAFTFSRAFSSTLAIMTQGSEPILQPFIGRRDALWFNDSLVALAFISVAYIVGVLLRPVAASLHVFDHEREAARRLLRAAGGSLLGYWAVRPGISYDLDQHSAIPYRVVDSTAIVLGDPFGEAEAIPARIAAFAAMCQVNDWRPACYQVSERWLPEFHAQGWRRVKIGEEALIDLPELRFTGKPWQDVRTALNRLPRDGYSAVWYDLAEDPADWLPALDRISREWLSRQKGGEKGFSMGTWETTLRDAEEGRALVLGDPDGKPAAFLTFVPCYGDSGWALDLMRRREGVPPGAMEFLLATALETFRDDGASLVSLGLSPMADTLPDKPDESPEALDRVRALIYEHLNHLYSFQGVHCFKRKFQPRWEPRYLIYPSLPALPRVLTRGNDCAHWLLSPVRADVDGGQREREALEVVTF